MLAEVFPPKEIAVAIMADFEPAEHHGRMAEASAVNSDRKGVGGQAAQTVFSYGKFRVNSLPISRAERII